MSTTSKHDVAVWKIHVYWMHLLVSLQILRTQARAWLSAVTEHMAVTLYAEVHLQWLLTVAPVFLLLPPFSKAFSLHPHWHWTPTEGFTEQISEMTFDRIWGGTQRETDREMGEREREGGSCAPREAVSTLKLVSHMTWKQEQVLQGFGPNPGSVTH